MHLTTGWFTGSMAPPPDFVPDRRRVLRAVIAGDPAADGTLLVTTAADTTAGPGTLALLNLGVEADSGTDRT